MTDAYCKFIFFGSVCYKMFKMIDLCLRFPGVCDMVLSHLDNQSLMRCKISSRELCHYLDNERFIFKRIIKKYISGQFGFFQCWKKVIYRAPTNILKQLATAVIQFSGLSIGSSFYRSEKVAQWSPLHIAAEQGLLPLVKHVHERILDKNPIEVTSMMSPLHLVAKNQDLDVCKFLIDEATDVNARNVHKETPLHYAAQEGHLKLFQLLFERLDNKLPEDFMGLTPYHIAARNGQLEICKFVFANTQDNNPANAYGQTPMHLAAQSGKLEVLRFFMKNIKDKIPRDHLGYTPLHYATRYELLRCVRTPGMCGRTCKCACKISSEKCARCACVRVVFGRAMCDHTFANFLEQNCQKISYFLS